MKYRLSALPWKLLAIFLAFLSLTFGFLAGYTTAWCLRYCDYEPVIVYQTTDNCYYLAPDQARAVPYR